MPENNDNDLYCFRAINFTELIICMKFGYEIFLQAQIKLLILWFFTLVSSITNGYNIIIQRCKILTALLQLCFRNSKSIFEQSFPQNSVLVSLFNVIPCNSVDVLLQVFSSSLAVFLCAKLVKHRLSLRPGKENLDSNCHDESETKRSNGKTTSNRGSDSIHHVDNHVYNGSTGDSPNIRNRYSLRNAAKSQVSNGHM